MTAGKCLEMAGATGLTTFDLTGRAKFNGIKESCNLFLNRNCLKTPKSCNHRTRPTLYPPSTRRLVWGRGALEPTIPDHWLLLHTSISGMLSG
jgi:hypothetical protein